MCARLVRRHLVAALAWVVLVTQAASFAHLLVVRHVVCVEHGELIHADAGENLDVADVRSNNERPGVAVHASGGATDDHVHCLLAMHRRETTGVPPGVCTVVPARAEESNVLALGDIVRPAPIAIYRLAPKNSPPI